MKSYLSIICIFISAFIFGQKSLIVAGKVISEEGAMPGAYVTIGTQGSITEDEGNFKFEYQSQSIPETIRIEVSALGYRTQQFDYPVQSVNLTDLLIALSLFPDINKETAREDIKKGNIRFLLSSGIAPVVYKSDRKFTRKYDVSYYEFGCEVISKESLYRYNAVVAKYLDDRCGKKWRKKVRDDIVGIN